MQINEASMSNSKTEKKLRRLVRGSAEDIAKRMVAQQLVEIRGWPWHRRLRLALRILIGR